MLYCSLTRLQRLICQMVRTSKSPRMKNWSSRTKLTMQSPGSERRIWQTIHNCQRVRFNNLCLGNRKLRRHSQGKKKRQHGTEAVKSHILAARTVSNIVKTSLVSLGK